MDLDRYLPEILVYNITAHGKAFQNLIIFSEWYVGMFKNQTSIFLKVCILPNVCHSELQLSLVYLSILYELHYALAVFCEK